MKPWSKTQAVISLSSAEAELYGMIKGSSHALGARSLLTDFGIDAGIDIHTDASAAIGITSRKGLGKLRHIETNQLWIQDKVRNRELIVYKCKGADNPADALTKPLKSEDLRWHFQLSGTDAAAGRSVLAPQSDS